MSTDARKLGALQREILAVLRDGYHVPRCPCHDDWYDEFIFARGGVKLAPGFHDFRAVLSLFATKHNRFSHCRFVEASFQAAFSRAVRGLERRGLLVFPPLVPIARTFHVPLVVFREIVVVDCLQGTFDLRLGNAADFEKTGKFIRANQHQRRFGRLANGGETFVPKRADAKTCSAKCRQKLHRKRSVQRIEISQ